MRVRWQPKTLIFAFSGLWLFLSGATSLWGATASILRLNENQILYLFSTSAQVLAGVYGLTLTGFVFFRNELSREEFEDETLADAVESLKRRYFTMLVFITVFVLLTFALSNLAMAKESGGHSLITTLLINSGQSAFGTSLLAISYFIFDVISPKRIELASRALQEKVDPTHGAPTKGNLEDFLRNYNQIEMLLSEYGSSSSITSSLYSSRPVRRTSNVRLAEILMRNERISQLLFSKLRDLITLRNSIIHGADPVVSSEIVAASQQVLSELGVALRVEP
ncbi:hypothetical protein DVJ77_17215 [Dyella tabacisoli]|uniref:RiboL-PSP-HEPN domain-containing protein n=1 Tax=Dyella tabacisoli TaxID=2282381 RepID=A0A369ULA8_9GAMM|nr:hypothetical protein DVJ77_17215 [Dyella tabacisoli]